MKRREFPIASAAGAALVVLGLASCGDDSSKVDAAPMIDATPRPDADPNRPDARRPDAQPGTCVISDASGISDSDGHTVIIPQASIDNPVTSVFNSAGGTHAHAILVSAAQLNELRASCAVTVTTSDTHPHTWTITMP